MTDWPLTLPQDFVADGYQDDLPNNVLSTSMEIGPPKKRRRSSTGVGPIRGTMLMTRAQTLICDNFYLNELEEVGYFNFVHPRTQETVVVQFAAPPAYTYWKPGKYRATINLEIQP